MIISAAPLKSTRSGLICGMCCQKLRGPCIRLFGKADRADKTAYDLYVHPDCLTEAGLSPAEAQRVRTAKKKLEAI